MMYILSSIMFVDISIYIGITHTSSTTTSQAQTKVKRQANICPIQPWSTTPHATIYNGKYSDIPLNPFKAKNIVIQPSY